MGVPDAARDDFALPPPATDRPAGADRTMMLLHAVIARRLKAGIWGYPIMAVAAGLILAAGSWPGWPPSMRFGLVFMVAASCVGLVLIVPTFGAWLPRSRELLAQQAWRPVPVAAGRPGSLARHTVLELSDASGQLDVFGLSDAAQRVIDKTGRIWLVGPNPRGWFTARIDGSHTPMAARRTRAEAFGQVRSEQPRPATTGTAADDQVAMSWAATMRRGARWRVWGSAGALGLVLLLEVFGVLLTGRVTLLGLVLIAFFCVILAWSIPATRYDRNLITRLRGGPWTRVDAHLDPWQPTWSATANATGYVTLGSGEILVVALPRASIDLLGTMWETGSVCVAGRAAAGRTMAVGFPGYPVLGTAVFG
jgi:hypothetical protein